MDNVWVHNGLFLFNGTDVYTIVVIYKDNVIT